MRRSGDSTGIFEDGIGGCGPSWTQKRKIQTSRWTPEPRVHRHRTVQPGNLVTQPIVTATREHQCSNGAEDSGGGPMTLRGGNSPPPRPIRFPNVLKLPSRCRPPRRAYVPSRGCAAVRARGRVGAVMGAACSVAGKFCSCLASERSGRGGWRWCRVADGGAPCRRTPARRLVLRAAATPCAARRRCPDPAMVSDNVLFVIAEEDRGVHQLQAAAGHEVRQGRPGLQAGGQVPAQRRW